MNYAVIDIETSPLPLDEISKYYPEPLELTEEAIEAEKKRIDALKTPKDPVKKAEKLQEWVNKWDVAAEKGLTDWYNKATLNPRLSKVVAVGFLTQAGKDVHILGENGVTEPFLLGIINEAIQNFDTVVGHNIIGFDIPYFYQRMLISGGQVSLPHNWRYKCFDVMERWLCGKRLGQGLSPSGLSYIAESMGFPAKNGNGADFWKWDLDRQREYLGHDVDLAHNIALRMGLETQWSLGRPKQEKVVEHDEIDDLFDD